MEVIIKDGNRTVNWEFPDGATVGDLVKKWEKGYYPVEEFTAWNRDGKLVLEVKTQFPKKKRKEEDDVR